MVASDHLFVSDNMGMVWRIDAQGNAERFVDATDFPRKITNFNDIEIDSAGNIYLSDSGDWEGGGGVIFRITQDKKITPGDHLRGRRAAGESRTAC